MVEAYEDRMSIPLSRLESYKLIVLVLITCHWMACFWVRDPLEGGWLVWNGVARAARVVSPDLTHLTLISPRSTPPPHPTARSA